MYKFNKKNKIILGIIITVLFSVITYYIYAKTDEGEITSYNDNWEENKIESNNEEKIQDTKSKDIDNADIIIVHITGCVANQGIVQLKENSRISDAIDAAGGLTGDADVSKINLAFILEDGMKIYVPSISENKNDNKEIANGVKEEDKTSMYVSKESGNIVSSKKENAATSKSSKLMVNINSASQTELEALPGIGASTATKIITYRNENGKFKTIEDIKNVKGIGTAKYEKIKEFICVK